MAPTHLSHAILAASNSGSLRALAERCSLSPSTLSKLVSTDRRIDESTLKALCSRTEDRIALQILFAHLRDEVDRAGRTQSEVAISARGQAPEDDLSILAEELREERSAGAADLRAVIHDLAELVRRYRRRLAESCSNYPTHEGRDLIAAEGDSPVHHVARQEAARRELRKRQSSSSSSSSSASA